LVDIPPTDARNKHVLIGVCTISVRYVNCEIRWVKIIKTLEHIRLLLS